MEKILRIGIAGAGTIVPAFLRALVQVEGAHAAAICATPDMEGRLCDLAGKHGIERVYLDYDEMVVDEELDVIYVAVPNFLHFSFSRAALEHGKSVICEKPFCSCAEEAEKLAAIARDRGLFLFEAISNQYTPAYQKARELLPHLGDVKVVALNYSQYSRRYDAFKRGEVLPVFDPKKSGGALMDINVYNVHFVTGLFGSPSSVRYVANVERGIDTSGVLVLRYPTFVCSLVGAKDCKAPASICVEGDAGCIHSSATANSFDCLEWEFYAGESGHFEPWEERERLFYELRHFVSAMGSGDLATRDIALEHSLTVQRILDEARAQASIEIVRSAG